jgi:HEAT repeat protein
VRATVEQIREAIADPDYEVRAAALRYFVEARSPDPLVMPRVLESINRFGLGAFLSYSFFAHLRHSEESVAWMLRELERVDADHNNPDHNNAGDRDANNSDATRSYRDGLLTGLEHVEAELLVGIRPKLSSTTAIDAETRRAIEYRLELFELPPNSLRQRFDEFCDRYTDIDDITPEADEQGRSIVDAMAQHRERFAVLAQSILDEDSDPCRSIMAARLAGRLRLSSAVPVILNLVEGENDYLNDEIYRALATINDDTVVNGIAARFHRRDEGLRSAYAVSLGEIHNDLSAATSLRLLEDEEDEEIRGQLLAAALKNFETDAVEPARQYLLNTRKKPVWFEVRDSLMTACKLTGDRFPEFDAWRDDDGLPEEPPHDQGRFEKARRLAELAQQAAFQSEFDDDDDDDPEDSDTVVRQSPRVGRNDPCPCGSGKKYKKCCYGKGAVEASGVDRSEARGANVARKASSTRYPVGTVAYYGPDDKRTTKIAAGVITREGSEPIMKRWVGSNVKTDIRVEREIKAFFKKHKIKTVGHSDGNMGCPHEEGPDFPIGEDCPFCPFWAGKQGSNRHD